MKVTFLASLAAAAIACAACAQPSPFQYSGTLQAESAGVGSTIGGRITRVFVSDGERVRKNQLLVTLDDVELRAELQTAIHQESQADAAAAQAQAQVDKTQSGAPHQVDIARAGIRAARAGLAQAQAQAVQSERDYDRARQLYVQGAIAAQAMDTAEAAYRTARAGVASARANLSSAHQTLDQLQQSSLPADVASAQQAYQAAVANRQAARAGVAAARSRLAEMFIRAPADGLIDALDLRAGDLVGPRAQVATVDEFVDPYVRIYVPQKDLSSATVGARVRVLSDALAGAQFDGRIESVDANAQFTPRDVQTAQDRSDLVFGVKIRVHDPQRRLHGGTTVEVALP
jgi:HlyD family secretion protein